MSDFQRAFGLCRKDCAELKLGVQTMEDDSVVKLCSCECKQHTLIQTRKLFGNRVLALQCNLACSVPCAVHMMKMGDCDLLDASLTWAEETQQARDKQKAHAKERTRKLMALRGACAELVDMHNAGLIHGDVKPENIVLQNNGSNDVVSGALIDFGNVWQIGQKWQPSRYTKSYAPEHLYGTPATPQIDLYGLAMATAAVMLMECVPEHKHDKISWITRCNLAFRLLHAPSAAAQLHIFDND